MNFSPSSDVAGPAADDHHDRLPVQLLRDERQRRRLAVDDDRHQLVRRLRDPVAVEAQDLPGLLHRPEQRPCQHLRAERHAAELELRDDPEVAAAPAHAPEEICVLVRARLDELSVGGHEIHRDELVDRQSVLAHDPADPAAEREPGDAGVRDDAGRHREPERLRLLVELAEQDARLHARRALLGIDADALHRREVDQQRVVCDRQAGERVPAAPHRDRQAAGAPELDRGDHVRDARAANDHRRVLVERAVPDLAMQVVVRVPGTNDVPRNAASSTSISSTRVLTAQYFAPAAKPDSRRASHSQSRVSRCSSSQAFARRFCARVSHASTTASSSSSRSMRARSGMRMSTAG